MITFTTASSSSVFVTLAAVPAIPGTIIDGATGMVLNNGKIIGDYIYLGGGHYFASLDNENNYQGTKAEVLTAIEAAKLIEGVK